MALLLSNSTITAANLVLRNPIFPNNNSPIKTHNPHLVTTSSRSGDCRDTRRARSRSLRSPLCVVATPVPSTEEKEKEVASLGEVEEAEPSASKFSWREHWYPVSLIEDLDPRLPTPFQLLGREIVLWKDRSTGDWVAFDLSERKKKTKRRVGERGTCVQAQSR